MHLVLKVSWAKYLFSINLSFWSYIFFPGKVSDGDMRQVRIYGDTDVKNVSQSLLENDQVSYGVLR